MALWAYALRTVDVFKARSRPVVGTTTDPLIEECINEASEMVEKAWGRHLVSRGALTEFHPRLDPLVRGASVYTPPISSPNIPMTSGPMAFALGAELYLNEWPIVSVTTVNEDAAAAYGGGTLLAASTDYLASKPIGKLVRLSGGLPRAWLCSWRAVKVVYLGGYQNTAGSISGADAVPNPVLRVFDELAGWMLRQRSGGEFGLSSSSDSFGNRTFSGPAYITPQMQAQLDQAGASASGLRLRTGERDS